MQKCNNRHTNDVNQFQVTSYYRHCQCWFLCVSWTMDKLEIEKVHFRKQVFKRLAKKKEIILQFGIWWKVNRQVFDKKKKIFSSSFAKKFHNKSVEIPELEKQFFFFFFCKLNIRINYNIALKCIHIYRYIKCKYSQCQTMFASASSSNEITSSDEWRVYKKTFFFTY